MAKTIPEFCKKFQSMAEKIGLFQKNGHKFGHEPCFRLIHRLFHRGKNLVYCFKVVHVPYLLLIAAVDFVIHAFNLSCFRCRVVVIV